MFRDTTAQDQVLTATGVRSKLPKWTVPAAIALVAAAGIAWVLAQWLSGTRSYDSERLRIATVTRGDLVRDIAADGRVIAANSPTLYAIAAGTVKLEVVAGDKVSQGQVLAVIDSPELRSQLVQEESMLASLEAGANRASLDARIARLNAPKTLDQAVIGDTTSKRELERFQWAWDRGAASKNELARAQDEVEKSKLGLATAREDYELQSAGADLDARNKRLLADRQRAVVVEAQRQVEALSLSSKRTAGASRC